MTVVLKSFAVVILTIFILACSKQPVEVEKEAYKCFRSGNYACAEENFRWLLAQRPNDVRIRANLAFSLTSQNKHTDAIKIYRDLISEGEGTYDLFAYYAKSLDAIGEASEAITWNYRALSIVPKLVDVRGSLATLLVKNGHPYEALALLTSFDQQLIEHGEEPYFKGRRIAITSSLPTQKNSNATSIRAAKIGNHYYSVVLGKSNISVPFMIDTGATHTTMSSKTFKTLGIAAPSSSRTIKFKTADNIEHIGNQFVLDELKIGPYTLQKVTVVVCDSCTSLLGQTTLEHFDLATNIVEGVEFIFLTPRPAKELFRSQNPL